MKTFPQLQLPRQELGDALGTFILENDRFKKRDNPWDNNFTQNVGADCRPCRLGSGFCQDHQRKVWEAK